MGCIMTPMPNHLSTLKNTPPQPCGDHARKGRGEEKSGVGKVEVWMRRGKSAKEQHQRNI